MLTTNRNRRYQGKLCSSVRGRHSNRFLPQGSSLTETRELAVGVQYGAEKYGAIFANLSEELQRNAV